ncbi:hypothetical protein C8J56DRAFT_124051 [Mycena floridula]|nr:hypothetical protein C8J56DRAFT_124051 [Mycena floridula]
MRSCISWLGFWFKDTECLSSTGAFFDAGTGDSPRWSQLETKSPSFDHGSSGVSSSLHSDTTLRHSDPFSVTLSVCQTTFHLHLFPNDDLVHPNARIRYHSTDPLTGTLMTGSSSSKTKHILSCRPVHVVSADYHAADVHNEIVETGEDCHSLRAPIALVRFLDMQIQRVSV